MISKAMIIQETLYALYLFILWHDILTIFLQVKHFYNFKFNTF